MQVLVVNVIYEFGELQKFRLTIVHAPVLHAPYKATKDSEELDKYKVLITLPTCYVNAELYTIYSINLKVLVTIMFKGKKAGYLLLYLHLEGALLD